MNGYIYKITNKINNKIYIGKTLNSIDQRFKEHKKDSLRKTNENRPLYKAMNKYGQDNFQIELIEEVPIDILADREIYWINKLNSYHFGYNATLGGDGKQLYDYNAIVKDYLSGKLIKELAQEYECSKDTIHKALTLANVNTIKNGINAIKKQLTAKDSQGNIIKNFNSRKEAAIWLYKNGYTKSNNWDNISATIGRAANGKRNSAYGLKWENI